MKKLLLLALWLCSLQLSAQNVSADSVDVSSDVSTKVTASDSISVFVSNLILDMMLQMTGSDYDMIYDRIAPDIVIAQRCGEFFEVNIITGEARLLPHYGEDEEDEATSQKRQSAVPEQQKADFEEPDCDDE
ncbi:MAG: hypothetical protein IJ824_04145 [Alphaproteobacteria bacterium]|nr:hypothetical protein [Alphaproteobacteria bacterium]